MREWTVRPNFRSPAAAHHQGVQPPLLPLDGQQVGEGLGGVVVAAVPSVDDGHGGLHRGHQGGALLGVAHGDNVGKAAHRPGGVRHALPFHGRGALGLVETQHLASKLIHGRLKAQTGAGRGLVKEGSQLFVPAFLSVGVGMLDDVFCLGNELVDLLHGQVRNVDEISFHRLTSPFYSREEAT